MVGMLCDVQPMHIVEGKLYIYSFGYKI